MVQRQTSRIKRKAHAELTAFEGIPMQRKLLWSVNALTRTRNMIWRWALPVGYAAWPFERGV